MRNQLIIVSLFLLFIINPYSQDLSTRYFFRLYHSSRCKYSLRIIDAWNQFSDEYETSSWDCYQQVCRYPTPTLIVFKSNTIQDIHVGSEAILTFFHETL
jgi:hypothetical protein